MGKQFSIFDQAALGSSHEIQQGGVVLTTDTAALGVSRTTRGTVAHSRRTRFVEFIVYGEGALTGKVSIGVCTSAMPLSEYVGQSVDSVGYRVGDGGVYRGGVQVQAAAVGAAGAVVGLLVAFGTSSTVLNWYLNGVFQAAVSLDHGSPLDSLADEELFWAVSLGSVAGADIFVFVNSGRQVYEYPVSTSQYEWATQAASAGAFRVSDVPYITHPTDDEPSTRYEGLLDNADFLVDRGVTFWCWGDRGASRGSVASISVSDPDDLLQELQYGSFRDQPVELSVVESGASVASAVSLGAFYLERVEPTSEIGRRITARDALSLLEASLLRKYIRPDAASESAFLPYPVLWGAVYSVAPPIIDDIEYIYAVDSVGISNMGKVRDKGDPLETTASPATYVVTDGGRKLDIRFEPQGIVTFDCEYTGDEYDFEGGDGCPPFDEIGGDGNPFTGTIGMSPTNWTQEVIEAHAGVPVLGAGGTVEFPHFPNNTFASYLKHSTAILEVGKSYQITITVDSMVAYTVVAGGQGVFLSPQAYQYTSFWNTLGQAPDSDYYPRTFTFAYTPLYSHPLYLGYHSNSGFATPIGAVVSLLKVIEIPVVDPEAGDAEVEDSLRGMPLALAMREAIEIRGGKPSGIWDQSTAAAIDTVTGYGGVGFYSSDQTTIRFAIDAMLDSYTASVYAARDGLLKVCRLVDPEVGTSVATLQDFIEPPIPAWDEARGLSRLMGVRRNEHILSESDFVSDDIDVSLSLRRRLGRRHRYIASTGAPLASGYEHADSAPPIDGRLVVKRDGFREISRVGALYSVSRSFYTCRIPRTDAFDIGDVVTVMYPRFNLNNGRKLLVVRIVENHKSDVMAVTFWGSSPTV